MNRIVFALLPLTVFLVGCGGDGAADDEGIPSVPTTEVRVERDNDIDIIARKFEIDGTTCVVISRDGGIDCDFK